MSTNNNPLTEIAAIVLAALLIIAGGLLLYTSKVDFTQATVIFGLAATIYGGNLALKAPSPAQTQLLAQLVTQQQAASGGGGQAPAQPAPGQMFTTQVPQPPNTTY